MIKQALVFLLLGAIVNVGVAWYCAVVVPLSMAKDWATWSKNDPASGAHWSVSRGQLRGALKVTASRSTQVKLPNDPPGDFVPAWVIPLLDYDWTQAPIQSVRIDARGWPWISMYSVHEWHTGLWRFYYPLPRNLPLRDPANVALPLHPVWQGLVTNTLFYASLLWLTFVLDKKVYRQRRVKRNLCPACEYPIGTSAVCTECGEPVVPRTA